MGSMGFWRMSDPLRNYLTNNDRLILLLDDADANLYPDANFLLLPASVRFPMDRNVGT